MLKVEGTFACVTEDDAYQVNELYRTNTWTRDESLSGF